MDFRESQESPNDMATDAIEAAAASAAATVAEAAAGLEPHLLRTLGFVGENRGCPSGNG